MGLIKYACVLWVRDVSYVYFYTAIKGFAITQVHFTHWLRGVEVINFGTRVTDRTFQIYSCIFFAVTHHVIFKTYYSTESPPSLVPKTDCSPFDEWQSFRTETISRVECHDAINKRIVTRDVWHPNGGYLLPHSVDISRWWWMNYKESGYIDAL